MNPLKDESGQGRKKQGKQEGVRGAPVKSEGLRLCENGIRKHIEVGKGAEKGAPKRGLFGGRASGDGFPDCCPEGDLGKRVHRYCERKQRDVKNLEEPI